MAAKDFIVAIELGSSKMTGVPGMAEQKLSGAPLPERTRDG